MKFNKPRSINLRRVFSYTLSTIMILLFAVPTAFSGPIEPFFASPQNDGRLFGPNTIIDAEVAQIKVIDQARVNPILQTQFEYSADGVLWNLIGIDFSPNPEPGEVTWLTGYGGMMSGFGGYGWTADWDTWTLPEGQYWLRATMWDFEGFTERTIPVFIDPTPPKPEYIFPLFEETVTGVIDINLDSLDENINFLEVAVQDEAKVKNLETSGTLVNQTGLGTQSQTETTTTGTAWCSPTATKNALERLIPTADETANIERVRELAKKMKTSNATGTLPGNIDSGLRDYLNQIGEDSSYTVTSVTVPRWTDYEKAMRSGESIIVSIYHYNPPGPDGIVGTADDWDAGHSLTMKDKDSQARAPNKYKISYVDPWGGGSHDSTWSANATTTMDSITYDPPWTPAADGGEWYVSYMWEISPKPASPPPSYDLIGTDSDSGDGWGVSWDTRSVSNGYHIIWASFTDDDGNSGAAKQVVYVENLNTRAGPGEETVTVDLGDVSVSFADVVIDGNTVLTTTGTPANRTGLPANFEFAGNLYDISTDASYTPPVQLTFSYTDHELASAGIVESELQIYHFDGATWEQAAKISQDTILNKITVEVDHLSIFGGGGSPTPGTGVNSGMLSVMALILITCGGIVLRGRKNDPFFT